MTALLVILLAAMGGLARYLLDAAIGARWQLSIPLAIPVINAVGSTVLGVAAGLRAALPETAVVQLVFVCVAAFAGAFTTYSTAAVQAATLLRGKRWRAAALYWLGMAIVCIALAGSSYCVVGAAIG